MEFISKMIKAIAIVLFCLAGGYYILATTIDTDSETDLFGRKVQEKSWISRLLTGEEYRKGTLDQWIDVLILGVGIGAGVGLWRFGDRIKMNKK